MTSHQIIPATDRAMSRLAKIVSGGQTGVDRGALDAGLALGFPVGGRCPHDRSAEDGVIPIRYPLAPLERGGYAARTRQNVLESDATLIVAPGRLSGGTALTLKLCRQLGKPVLVIDATRFSATEAADLIASFLDQHGVRILNVAGPRASGWPQGQAYTEQTIRALISALAS